MNRIKKVGALLMVSGLFLSTLHEAMATGPGGNRSGFRSPARTSPDRGTRNPAQKNFGKDVQKLARKGVHPPGVGVSKIGIGQPADPSNSFNTSKTLLKEKR